MLSDFGLAISAALELFRFEFTIWGYTFSFWQLMLFGMISGILIWFLREVFMD